MKQRIKKDNRPKALFGALATIGGALIGAATNIITAKKQAKLQEEQMQKEYEEQQRQQRQNILSQNLQNAINAQTNQQQALNYGIDDSIENSKLNTIKTLDVQQSQFRCGGKKRMKRNGGTVTTNLNKLNLYI